MKKSLCILLLLTPFFFIACEKEIDLNLPPYESKIVIEGSIEDNEYPWVFLTKNQGYLDEFEIPALDSTASIEEMMAFVQKYMITDATVIVNDGIQNDTLTFGINPDILNSQSYIYPPVKFIGKKNKGEVGKTYYLTVIHEGETYTSFTTIPKPFVQDSVWYEPDKSKPGFGLISALITDDPSVLNYYTYFCKREGKDKYFTRGARGFSLWDDKMFNGMESFEIPVMRGKNGGYDANKEDNEEESRLFKEGDSITIKVCTMDNASYRFWKTASSSGGSMMGQPAQVETNIRGALGVWCGYGVSYVGVRCVSNPNN